MVILVVAHLALALDVFTSGMEGYNCYRIPALVTLPTGVIALFAEGRRYSCNDHGAIDIVYKVSADGGSTWSPLRVAYGESKSTGRNVTIGNPAPVVVGGRVMLVFCRDNKRVLTLLSEDAGGTEWPATPNDITEQLFGETELSWVATGPPGGIVHLGAVLVALNWTPVPAAPVLEGGAVVDEGGLNQASTMLSLDGGVTWRRSFGAFPHGNEAQVAAAPNGSLLLNMRTTDDARLLAWSDDLGRSWLKPARRWPSVGSSCAGSTIRASDDTLLFSHNFGHQWRRNLTLWASTDSGATWRVVAHAGNASSGAAYSTLVARNATHAGLVFERGTWYRALTWDVIAFRGDEVEAEREDEGKE